jgi:hypothetical protein
MASRQEVYAKFGEAAEAAQLIETELGTFLLIVSGLALNWHVDPDPVTARRILDDIEGATLGKVIGSVKTVITIDDGMAEKLSNGLKARNRLFHGFYEKHNFKIDTDEGRDIMMQDLDALHADLLAAYWLASAMTGSMAEILEKDAAAGGRNRTVN